MATKRIVVEQLAEADIEETAAALARAFQNDSLISYVFPDPIERAEGSPVFFALALRYARRIGAAYAPAGVPVGAAFGWRFPIDETALADAPEDSLESAPQLIGEAAFARFLELIGHIDEETARVVPPPCWYLAGLGVDPAYQRQGIGSALVQAFLDLATDAGIPACLAVGNPDNLPFYRNLGMEIAREDIAPDSGMPYWILRWDAS